MFLFTRARRKLSDVDGDNRLTLAEFSVAMHLIMKVCVVDCHNQERMLWVNSKTNGIGRWLLLPILCCLKHRVLFFVV